MPLLSKPHTNIFFWKECEEGDKGAHLDQQLEKSQQTEKSWDQVSAPRAIDQSYIKQLQHQF